VLSDEYPEDWPKLLDPPDVSWRHKATDLREEVQRAKETLSEVTVCQLWVPGIERDVQLTRGELEKLIESDIEATVDCLERALDDANVKAKDLAGIYLVGGSSRIPLVGSSIYRRLQVMPSVQDNPKSVVALGGRCLGHGAQDTSPAGRSSGRRPIWATHGNLPGAGRLFQVRLLRSRSPANRRGTRPSPNNRANSNPANRKLLPAHHRPVRRPLEPPSSGAPS
jgi:hypothetical protein